jgi:hypothetical protein
MPDFHKERELLSVERRGERWRPACTDHDERPDD